MSTAGEVKTVSTTPNADLKIRSRLAHDRRKSAFIFLLLAPPILALHAFRFRDA
jgi:hypothetical protein